MGFGVGFRVAPGVRLRSSRRGPRVSLGPRIARVHLGGGVPAVSTGKGRFTVWRTLSGGGQTAPTTGRRRASPKKQRAWTSVRDHLDSLLTQHHRPVAHAVRPVVPPAPPVQARSVRRELRRQQRRDVPWWRWTERRAAKQRADALAEAEIPRRQAARAAEHEAEQAEADRWWAALNANDPEVVTDQLEEAFAEHGLPAVPTDVVADTAHLVVSVLPVEKLIGPREPSLTAAGNLSLARMTKTRRHELFQAAVGSAVIAVAAEAFATCPGLAAVDVAVVCPEALGGPAVLQLIELSRVEVLPGDATVPVDSTLTELAAAGRATLVEDRGGRIGALRPLAEEDPDVRALLDVLDAE